MEPIAGTPVEPDVPPSEWLSARAVRVSGVFVAVIAASACSNSHGRPGLIDLSGTAGSASIVAEGGSGGTEGRCPAVESTIDYPAGPYGTNNPPICSTIEDLAFRGFVNDAADALATSRSFGDYSMGTLRSSGRRYALLHIAAIWCTSCQVASADLGARGREIVDAGGAVVEIVNDGLTPGTLPTSDELAAWVAAENLTVTTVEPGDDRSVSVFPEREWVYIVDLDSMRIVWKKYGLGTTPPVTTTGIDTMLRFFL